MHAGNNYRHQSLDFFFKYASGSVLKKMSGLRKVLDKNTLQIYVLFSSAHILKVKFKNSNKERL